MAIDVTEAFDEGLGDQLRVTVIAPRVWRSGRTAAAKVDALASQRMDVIESPAFAQAGRLTSGRV